MRSLALLAVLLVAISAHAQPVGPARILERYALLASESLRARKLRVDGGDLGVNAGRMVASNLTAPSARLVAARMRLGRDAVCNAAFAGEVRSDAASCPTAGPDGGSVVTAPADACGMPAIVPACASGEHLIL